MAERLPSVNTTAAIKKAKSKADKVKKYNSPYGKTPGKLMTLKQLIELTGISQSTIQKLRKEGLPTLQLPGRSDIRYNSSMVLDFIHQREIAKVQSQLDEVIPDIDHAQEMAEAQRRKAVAEAVLSEIKVAKEQGLVANIDDLMENFSEAITNVRGALMSFRARLPGMLAHSSEEEVATILDREVKDTLNALVEYNHEYKE
ncbi:MAG: hypothetical protein ACPHWY_13535 [Pseudoalteromonas tetraodonis]